MSNAAGTPHGFMVPAALAIDAGNQLYVAEWQGSSIFRVSADGRSATHFATVNSPMALTIDPQGNLYVMGISDVRKITPAGVVTLLATLWNDPVRIYLYPQGLAVDAAGNVFATDSDHHCIRRIAPDGTVTTVPGTTGRFVHPCGLAIDAAGNLYVSDSSTATISKVTPDGTVTTFAGAADVRGSVDGPGSEARFVNPVGLACDGAGNLYVSDSSWESLDHHTIRRISPEGMVTTIGGSSGAPGHINGPGNVARFHLPLGIAVDASGNLYVGEEGNHAIRKGVLNVPPVIIEHPLDQTREASGAVVLNVAIADSTTPCSYQWRRDGVDLPGATGATLTLPCVQCFQAGDYSVVVTNEHGSTTSAVARVTVPAPPPSDSRLLNLSNRGFASVGAHVMIPGFVISAEGPKTLLVRVVGPALAAAPYRVPDTMADPHLALFRQEDDATSTLLLTQDNWSESVDAAHTAAVAVQVGAFPLASGSRDAAFVVTLPPGVYTVVGSSADGTSSGIVLVEIYVVE
jgi:sugar lactone lactonase YvrE